VRVTTLEKRASFTYKTGADFQTECKVRNVGISQTCLSLDKNFHLKTTAATEMKCVLNESPK